MESEQSLNIFDLPTDPIEKRAAVISRALQTAIPRTVTFISNEYPRSYLLRQCLRFTNWDLLDAPRSDSESLRRVWFFPWAEATREFDQVQTACMLTMYKAAHDHLRRALELVMAGIYFTLENTPEEKARAWISGADGTPYFTKTLKRIVQHSNFSGLEEACNWSGKLKQLYWSLSDVTHVRGQDCGFHTIQPSHLHLGDVSVPEFSAQALTRVLDFYIAVTRNIATAMAASNPILLVGLDLDSKFGLNDPVSGFFNPGQAELLRELIVDETRSVLDVDSAMNPEVQGVVAWVTAMPDITEEQLEMQVQELRQEQERN